jgi:hypothetical protein
MTRAKKYLITELKSLEREITIRMKILEGANKEVFRNSSLSSSQYYTATTIHSNLRKCAVVLPKLIKELQDDIPG